VNSAFGNKPHRMMKVFQSFGIHPDDGNCNVYRNVGRTSTFYADYSESRTYTFQCTQVIKKDRYMVIVIYSTEDF
jgi:hypothetical protein